MIINESKSLTKDEQDAICILIASDARAGIVEARDITKKIEHDGSLVFTPHEIDYLRYFLNNIKSPKYNRPHAESALKKIIGK